MRGATLVALAALLAACAGCGGGGKKPIRIGVLGVCRGVFAPYYDEIVAGAELPLLARGGKPAGASPPAGVSGAKVAGRRVELRLGCSDDSGARALAEARRLVEREGVRILVGPETSAAAIALRDYARTQPDVAFLIAIAPAADPTLQRPAPNVFRFTTNALQWPAGLGSYAYRTLGWRRAVVIGNDFQFPWAEGAGFTAEFCALGGRVVDRIWSDAPTGVPAGVDGYFLSEYIPPLLAAAVRAVPVRGSLARKVLLGGASIGYAPGLGPRAVGVVGGGAAPIGSRAPAWTSFVARFKQAFPKVPFAGFSLYYFTPMEAALRGLEQAGGDETRLMDALRGLRFETPTGPVRLNGHRQAIAPNYLLQVTRAGLRTIRTVPAVDDSYAGRFSSSKLPSRTYPPCTHGNPPAWAQR
jgi:branched-chain amino acid transport system substrate-binding protein